MLDQRRSHSDNQGPTGPSLSASQLADPHLEGKRSANFFFYNIKAGNLETYTE